MASITPARRDEHERFANGFPGSPRKSDIREFAQYKLKVYASEPWSEIPLSLYFGEDFGQFPVNMFGTLRQGTRRRLRDLIREKGKFVERSRGVVTRDALLLQQRKN